MTGCAALDWHSISPIVRVEVKVPSTYHQAEPRMLICMYVKVSCMILVPFLGLIDLSSILRNVRGLSFCLIVTQLVDYDREADCSRRMAVVPRMDDGSQSKTSPWKISAFQFSYSMR